MKLRYSKALTIGLIVVGALLLLISLASGDALGTTAGGLLAVVGVLLTLNPILVLADGEIQQKNALGMTLKRHPVSGPSDLLIDGNKMVHVPTGKRIGSLGFGADKSDVEQWRSWAGQAPTAS